MLLKHILSQICILLSVSTTGFDIMVVVILNHHLYMVDQRHGQVGVKEP